MCPQTRLPALLLLCLCGASFAAEPKCDRFGDPLPEGAVARLGSLRLRNEAPISATAFSADGKTLVVCDTNSLAFWDLATGRPVRRVVLKKNAAQARLRYLSSDGKMLVQSGFDNVLRFVDTATGAEQHTLNHAACGSLQALELSRDGKILAAVHQASIALWDVPSGKLLHEFKGPPITPLLHSPLIAVTPDGKQLVMPHADASLHLLDVATGKELRNFEMLSLRQGFPPHLRLQRLALSPDGRYLAYGGPATPLTVCELATGKRLRELAPPQGILSGLAFTPNGRFLAAGDHIGIHFFGVLSGKEIRKFPMRPGGGNLLVFAPNGRMLATLRGGHTINLWDVAAERQPHPLIGHETPVCGMVFFPGGKRLVSTDSNGGMIVWDIASGQDRTHLRNGSPMLPPVVEGDGESLSFLRGTAVFHWDARTGRQELQASLAGQAMNALALSPDRRSVVSMTYQPERQLHLFDLTNNKPPMLLHLPGKAWISQAVFTPDSRRLATTSSDRGLCLWSRDTGALLRELKKESPGRQPTWMIFAADGRSLAFFDGMVHIREIASDHDRLRISPPSGFRHALAYSPDARFFACQQSDGRISVYSASTGKPLAQWQSKQGFVRSLAFSRESRLLASGSENGTILIWEVPKEEALPAVLTAEKAVSLWQTLSDSDAAAANRALAALTAVPAQTLPLFKERLHSLGEPLDRQRLARRIAELDDDSFQVRERASRELASAAPDAADDLRQALDKHPSLESKKRIEDLLSRLKSGSDPERLRFLRAVEVVERIGSPQAKELLRELAGEPMSARLLEEVQASLRRMDAKPSR